MLNFGDANNAYVQEDQDDRLLIQSARTALMGGYVGIGTTSPVYTLDVNGYIQGWNVSPSDARWKTNVKTIHNALDSVLRLNGVSFEWKPDSEKHFPNGNHLGLIAQEVEKVLPEVITTDARGYRSVAYQEIVPVLVEAVKEQQKTIEIQQKELQRLRLRNDDL